MSYNYTLNLYIKKGLESSFSITYLFLEYLSNIIVFSLKKSLNLIIRKPLNLQKKKSFTGIRHLFPAILTKKIK